MSSSRDSYQRGVFAPRYNLKRNLKLRCYSQTLATGALCLALVGCISNNPSASPTNFPATGIATDTPNESQPNGTDVRDSAVTLVPQEPTAPPSGFDSNGDGWYAASEYVLAIEALFPRYDWPSAFGMTEELLVMTIFQGKDPGDDPNEYQVGLETTVLRIVNTCAWFSEWLAARSDQNQAREASALDVMVNLLPHLPGAERNSPSSVEAVNNAVAAAQLGDPALVQQHVNANCTMLTFIPGESTPP